MANATATGSATPLLEREGELKQLDRVVEDACAGLGRLVLIEGPPGIGKSRLLEAVRARARERGMLALSARVSELDRELPVLLALAARSPEPGVDRQTISALATDPLARVLRPAPLTDSAVGQLVASELGDDPDPSFCHACREATGGNPFLLRELLLELAADDVTPDAAHVPLVRQLAPAAVTRAVLLRLARLGYDATALARAVAVLGDGTPLRRAGILAALPEARAGELAASLAEADILTSGRPLAFVHPILRSAVYADVEPAERARAHRAAAALLADEGAGANAIAVHLLATEPSADAYVVATLREAAAQALARGAAPTAVACLRRGRGDDG